LLNAGKGVLCSLACFGVGHTEHIVGFNSTVNTRVPRDRVTQLKALGSLLDTVEGSDCVFLSLILLGLSTVIGARFTGRVVNSGGFNSKEGVD
jgi:hypothetical protein